MRTRPKGFQLRPASPEVIPALTAAAAAERLGVSRKALEEMARTWHLEPTYSISEVAAHLGIKAWAVNQLVQFGLRHGQALHPTRGGLYPTFKAGPHSRRIPLSAIERHKRHMAKAHDGWAAGLG